MALYSKKLHLAKNGKNYNVDLYDDIADINNSYPNNKYGKLMIDGKQLYFPINVTLSGLTEGDTPLRIKFNGQTYQVNNHSAHIISVNSPANAWVNVNLAYPDGRTTSIGNGGSITVPFGTTFNVNYSPSADYRSGGVNLTSGAVTRRTNIQAGNATAIEYSQWCKDNDTTSFNIPNWVRVLKVKPDRKDAFYIPFYMNQARSTAVIAHLNNADGYSIYADDGNNGNFINNSGDSPYASGYRRHDNDNVVFYWSREINNITSFTGNVGSRGGGKNSHPYAFGWEF